MRQGREAFFPATAAAALALFAWLCFVQQLPLRSGVAFHHMASVRELAKGELPPCHNLVAARTPQAHYGPYLVLLGLVRRVSGADPLLILEAAGLGLLLLFLLAFRALAERVLGAQAARWSAVTALLFWGPWFGPDMPWIAWGWPGTTSLADTQNFFYPQHAAVVLLLALLAICVGRRLAGRRLAVAVLLSAGLVTTHPLTALALAAAVAALVASEISLRTAQPRRVATLLLLPAAGLLVAGLWPYYPVWRLLRALVVPAFRQPLPPLAVRALGAAAQGAAQAQGPTGIDYATLLLPPFHILGPALVGLVWAVVLARRRQPFLLLWSLGALLMAVSPLVPLRERLVTFAALPLQLAAAGLCEAAWRRGAASRGALGLLLAACSLATAERIAFVRGLEPIKLEFVAQLTPDDAVILASERTSNAVAGLTGRKIVAPEGPDIFLVMEDGAWRMRDVLLFLRPSTTTAQREVILRRWHVTHVLLDRLAPFPLRLPYPIVYEGGGYRLYDVRGVSGRSAGLDARQISPVATSAPASRRNRHLARAKRISSPWHSSRSATTSPFTRVRLVEPRSRTQKASSRRSMRACWRETSASSTRMSAAVSRPTTMTALSSANSTVLPSGRAQTSRAAPLRSRPRAATRAEPRLGRRC